VGYEIADFGSKVVIMKADTTNQVTHVDTRIAVIDTQNRPVYWSDNLVGVEDGSDAENILGYQTGRHSEIQCAR
jgi:hypothetical protein